MRVAAVGDAHLGRSYYPVTTSEGVNQCERDFELAFEAAIDAALAQDPDLVVWLGDVFDHPRPTYRSFRVAQRGLARIREHGVPAVVISGNHDTPRLPGTGSPYSALADAFDNRRGTDLELGFAGAFPGPPPVLFAGVVSTDDLLALQHTARAAIRPWASSVWAYYLRPAARSVRSAADSRREAFRIAVSRAPQSA